MKETPLSNCERRFLLRAIEEKKVKGSCGTLHALLHGADSGAACAGRGSAHTSPQPPGGCLAPAGCFQALGGRPPQPATSHWGGWLGNRFGPRG
jgi:hypothetical protein